MGTGTTWFHISALLSVVYVEWSSYNVVNSASSLSSAYLNRQILFVCDSIFNKSPHAITYTETTSVPQLREKHLLDDSVLEEQQQQLIHHSRESPNGRHIHDEGPVDEEGEQLLTRHG